MKFRGWHLLFCLMAPFTLEMDFWVFVARLTEGVVETCAVRLDQVQWYVAVPPVAVRRFFGLLLTFLHNSRLQKGHSPPSDEAKSQAPVEPATSAPPKVCV